MKIKYMQCICKNLKNIKIEYLLLIYLKSLLWCTPNAVGSNPSAAVDCLP